MTRRKREIVGLRNERVRSVFLEIDAFHPRTTHPSPPRTESTRGRAISYSILLSRYRYCGCIPQSLRERVLDPRTHEAQATDGYVVGLDWREV
jgi:hypothetical protein